MTPTWQTTDGSIRLYLGDNRLVRDSLPNDASIISDPPYGMKWNTDYTRFTGGLADNRNHGGKIAEDHVDFDPAPWLRFPRVVLWGQPFFARLLPVGTTLVWDKKRESQTGKFLSDAELAWMKGGCGVYIHRQVWNGFDRDEGGGIEHPVQKPVRLMQWCIAKAKAAGSLIVDPYMGSGTTALAAIATGSPFIGCEIDPMHFATAVRRIDAELSRAPLWEEKPQIQRSFAEV